MPNTCPTIPYSKKENPYTPKESKYTAKHFCPFDYLLMEDGEYLLQENGAKIALEQ